MKLQACRSCGGALERKGNHYYCRFCGNRWAIDAADDVHVVDRANAWAALRDCDFERSAELFENIILKEPKSHEAYWGRCLALSGIIYVTDLNENKKVPTCNNISEDSFLDHPDYKKAIDYAPAEIAESYKKQGEQIEKIRLEWLGKARKEPPYDVFISFKDSDREKGVERTQDSIDAQDLYNALVAEGYKVFFSRISLRNKVSEQYEPYIYNAIKTAKVMIVFGESPEYFSAVWIKNEWSRFKTRIENGEKHKNSLVVAYKNMDPATLPVVLRTRQCLNAAEMTFLPDLLRHIKRVVDESKQASHIEKIEIKGGQISKRATKIANETITTREIGEGAIANTDVSEKQQLDLVKTYIKSGEWEDAENLLDTILFSNPTYAEAIWLSLAVKFRVKSDKAIIEKLSLFTNEDYSLVEKILNCATKSFATQLLDLLYLSYNVVESEIFFRIIQLILPYKYEHRESRIRELFEYSITDDKFTLFKLFISTLDSTAVDEYISYNFKYIENTKSSAAEIECLENILSVDNGNIDALKMKFNIQRIGASFELLTQNFEEILKYSKEPQNEVIEVFNLISKTVATEDYCKFAIQLLKYYDGELSDFKDTLVTLASNMLKNGFFDHAEHIYKLILTFEPNNAAVYWGICLIKLGARSDRDVIKAETSIKTIPEYTKYLTLVDESRRIECISLAKSQEMRKKNKERRKKLNKRIVSICAISISVTCISAFLLWRILLSVWYNGGVKLINEGRYAEALQTLEKVDDYLDAKKLANDCRQYLNLEYTLKDDHYIIASCSEKESEIIIPSIYNGKPVTEIGDFAFSDNSILEKIIIPNSVTNIGNDAFKNCAKLKSIELPSGITNIGINLFKGCSNLTNITIPNTVTNIDSFAFCDCISLESIDIPIGIKSIGNSAFSGCTSLKSITISSGVTNIGSSAFENCPNIESIEVHTNNKTYHSIENCLIATNNKQLILGCKNSVIPTDGSVTNIGNDAFYGCSNLTSITIPDCITSIGIAAFKDCINLRSITLSSKITSINSETFFGCANLKSITIPNNVTSIGDNAFNGCSSLTSITIPNTVSYIGDAAFKDCIYLKSVELPQKIISIKNDMFNGCSSLTSITIPNTVTNFGDAAFKNCTRLKSIELPIGITNIGNALFYGCSSLTSIEIPDGVKKINEGAFSNCSSLNSLIIPKSVTSINASALFTYSASLKIYYQGSQAEWNNAIWYGNYDKEDEIRIKYALYKLSREDRIVYNYVPEE